MNHQMKNAWHRPNDTCRHPPNDIFWRPTKTDIHNDRIFTSLLYEFLYTTPNDIFQRPIKLPDLDKQWSLEYYNVQHHAKGHFRTRKSQSNHLVVMMHKRADWYHVSTLNMLCHARIAFFLLLMDFFVIAHNFFLIVFYSHAYQMAPHHNILKTPDPNNIFSHPARPCTRRKSAKWTPQLLPSSQSQWSTFAFTWHKSQRLIAANSLRMPFADVDSDQALF